MMLSRYVAACVGVATLTGCGVQATTGYDSTSADPQRRIPISTTATLQSSRKTGGVIGVRSTEIIDNSLTLKQVVLHGGVDYLIPARWPGTLPRRLAIEGGADFGAGGPTTDRFRGVGSYVGASLTPRARLFGDDDLKRSFSIIFVGLELVANARWGAWFPPEGSGNPHVFTEAAIEGGLRIVFGSDVTSSAQGRPSGDQRPDDGEREEAP